MPRRVLQNRNEMRGGQPPLLRCASQLNGELEAAIRPARPMSGHVTNLHPGSRPGAGGRRGVDGRGEAGQGLAVGACQGGQGRAPVARRPTTGLGFWCCMIPFSLERLFIQIFSATHLRRDPIKC